MDSERDTEMLKDLIQRLEDKALYFDLSKESRNLLCAAIALVGLASYSPKIYELIKASFREIALFMEEIYNG